jgi:hypothetical protein
LTNQITREDAIRILKEKPYSEEQVSKDLEFITKRMGITRKDFKIILDKENKSYKDYKNTSWLIKLGVLVARYLGIEKRQFR